MNKIKIRIQKWIFEFKIANGLYPKWGYFCVDTGNKFDSEEYIWHKGMSIVGTVSDGRCWWHGDTNKIVNECYKRDRREGKKK